MARICYNRFQELRASLAPRFTNINKLGHMLSLWLYGNHDNLRYAFALCRVVLCCVVLCCVVLCCVVLCCVVLCCVVL